MINESFFRCFIGSPKQLTAVASGSKQVLVKRRHENNQNMDVYVPVLIDFVK